MKIRYIYSATVVIETEDCKVLCDPWFSPPYDGSWAHWPRIENPLEVCGPADYVFISHIHPDHYDPTFLQQYLAKYPQAKVLIADMKPALLERKLIARGVVPNKLDHLQTLEHGQTFLSLQQNWANTVNIDSALVVRHGDLSVANLNDNPFDEQQIKNIKYRCGGSPTVALLPFVGAGPWPQCYEMDSGNKVLAALAKKAKYLDLFKKYCEALQPKVAVPFAGQYWLHGPQLDLNPLRGMADATECFGLGDTTPEDGAYIWVPADGGQSIMDVASLTFNSERLKPYDWSIVRQELKHFAVNTFEQSLGRYRYEREIQVPVERLPLLKLLQSASGKVYPTFKNRPNLDVCIKTQLPQWFNLRTDHWIVDRSDKPCGAEPRVEVTLDARYLYGMLTRLYNANSVRIGSLCRFKCVPNVYDKELDDLFGEFWDSLRV